MFVNTLAEVKEAVGKFQQPLSVPDYRGQTLLFQFGKIPHYVKTTIDRVRDDGEIEITATVLALFGNDNDGYIRNPDLDWPSSMDLSRMLEDTVPGISTCPGVQDVTSHFVHIAAYVSALEMASEWTAMERAGWTMTRRTVDFDSAKKIDQEERIYELPPNTLRIENLKVTV